VKTNLTRSGNFKWSDTL